MNPSQNPSAIRSKQEITQALLTLMNEYPYEEITVKQILFQSKVSRKTFYRNFSSKDDVLDAYIDSLLCRYIQSLQDTPGCQLSNILDMIFEFCTQNREFLFLLRDNGRMHMLLEKWNTCIPILHRQIVKPDHPMFQSFSEKEVDCIIAFNIGAIWNVIDQWVTSDMAESQDMIRETLLRYVQNLSFFM
ncbi:MAG: TetR/AcrR family transcriptional regulator [Lachnospiraceae bacterium]